MSANAHVSMGVITEAVVMIRGGEDSWDPLCCRLFSTKEPLNTGRGGGLGSRPIFKKFNEPYALS